MNANMMGCRCELCGALIYSGRIGSLQANPGMKATPEEYQAAADLAEFDLLAARVAGHIAQSHPKQAQQMAAFGFLASKVYAMTQAETSYDTERFNAIRAAWKDGIVKAMQDQPAAAPSEAGASTPPNGS